MNTTVDLTGLNRVLGGLQEALIGAGQYGDARNILKDETGRLAMEIGRLSGPKNQSALAKKIERDVNKQLAAPEPNIETAHQGHGSVKWISATPKFLLGTGQVDKNQRPNITLGQRGKQRIVLLNRKVVTKSQLAQVKARLKSHIGRFKASWMQTANELGQKDIPAWISRHFPTPKNVSDLTGLSAPEAIHAMFGSRAPGVERNAGIVQIAVNLRIKKIVARIQLVLSGYRRDVAEHIRPRTHAHESQ